MKNRGKPGLGCRGSLSAVSRLVGIGTHNKNVLGFRELKGKMGATIVCRM